MSEKKFQVGDRVRFIRPGYNRHQSEGAEATVVRLDADGHAILDTDNPDETLGWAESVEVIGRNPETSAVAVDTPDAAPKPLTAGRVRALVHDFYQTEAPGLLAFIREFNELDNAQVLRFAELLKAGAR